MKKAGTPSTLFCLQKEYKAKKVTSLKRIILSIEGFWINKLPNPVYPVCNSLGK